MPPGANSDAVEDQDREWFVLSEGQGFWIEIEGM